MTQNTGNPRHHIPFVMVPVDLIADPPALAMYSALAAYTNARTGTAWPGQERLADDMDCTVRTVQNRLAALARDGWVTVQHTTRPDGSQGSNQYRIKPVRMTPVDKPVEKGVHKPEGGETNFGGPPKPISHHELDLSELERGRSSVYVTLTNEAGLQPSSERLESLDPTEPRADPRTGLTVAESVAADVALEARRALEATRSTRPKARRA